MRKVSEKKKKKLRAKLNKKVMPKERAKDLPTHRLMDELNNEAYVYSESTHRQQKAYIREAKRRLHWWRFW